jgi:hypothetical protein
MVTSATTRPGHGTRRRSKALKPTQPSVSEHERHPGNGAAWWPEHRRHANGKKATTAVTRNGCRRGSSFEGSELRCGDLATAPVPPLLAVSRNVRARNAANLMTGSGMQQAREPPGGGSRRSGEKPHGRNRTFGVDLREPKRDGHVAREWTPGVMSVERRTARRSVSWPSYADESHERRLFTTRARGECSEEEPRP